MYTSVPKPLQRGSSFFPTADAAILHTKHKPPEPTSRPNETAPIFDVEHHQVPLRPYETQLAHELYPPKEDVFAPAPTPPTPPPETIDQEPQWQEQCGVDRYLFPLLTRNERLRLTMFFYYTRGALEDEELQSRLAEKVHLASETVGWEFVIAGLLSHNTYTRMVTVGLPLAVLPRRESTCAHTVNQPPGTVFSLLSMHEDWRFKESPHVKVGGLRAYAGVPLRFETEFGDHVAFGSLCVASNSPEASLDKSQQQALARLADWIVLDIIHSARARRQRERRRMLELLGEAHRQCGEDVDMAEHVPRLLRSVYPNATIGIYETTNGEIELESGTVFRPQALEHGLLEDTEYFDRVIDEQNHGDLVAPRIVRVIGTQCASPRTPTFLLVGSKDFRDVYDDIDSWFVSMCAALLCRYWQGHALKEALKAKDIFLRGITHQLRTPIHGILGSVELLAEELKVRDAISQTTVAFPAAEPDVEPVDPYVYLKTIRTSANELISTVNSLLKLNQWADIARTVRVITFHNIGDMETALLDSLPAPAEDVSLRPSIAIYHRFPPWLDMLSMDLSLFLDCIQPLLANAIENTACGLVTVTLSFDTNGNKFVIDVEDNGRGIAAADHGRIFAAYEKVDEHTIDAGLGLTLAYKSAELMNGTISLVESELGKGSHFRAAFDEIPSASSFPRRTWVKERLTHLPPHFHEVSLTLPSATASLRHVFANFLGLHGYTASGCQRRSLILLDYTQDVDRLRQYIQQLLPNQVAICPIPESAITKVNFESYRIHRKKNVIYVKAPLLTSTIEETLEQADAVMAELASPPRPDCQKHDSSNALKDELEPSQTPPSNDGAPETPPLRNSKTFPGAPPHPEPDITTSLDALHINVRPPTPKPPLGNGFLPVGRKPVTLLVDDNVVNLRLLEMHCHRRSVPYRPAKDGAEAVRLFEEQRRAADSPSLIALPDSPILCAADAIPLPALPDSPIHTLNGDDSLHGDTPTTSHLPLPPPPTITKPQKRGKLKQDLQPFDLIFMDLQMPICDGICATRKIRDLERENPGWGRCCIVIVTGQDSKRDRVAAEEAGADGYMVKPVALKRLDGWFKQWEGGG